MCVMGISRQERSRTQKGRNWWIDVYDYSVKTCNGESTEVRVALGLRVIVNSTYVSLYSWHCNFELSTEYFVNFTRYSRATVSTGGASAHRDPNQLRSPTTLPALIGLLPPQCQPPNPPSSSPKSRKSLRISKASTMRIHIVSKQRRTLLYVSNGSRA